MAKVLPVSCSRGDDLRAALLWQHPGIFQQPRTIQKHLCFLTETLFLTSAESAMPCISWLNIYLATLYWIHMQASAKPWDLDAPEICTWGLSTFTSLLCQSSVKQNPNAPNPWANISKCGHPRVKQYISPAISHSHKTWLARCPYTQLGPAARVRKAVQGWTHSRIEGKPTGKTNPDLQQMIQVNSILPETVKLSEEKSEHH